MTALGVLIRTSTLLICVSVLAFVLRRASASVRHALWAIGLLAVLVFPVVSEVLPKWELPVLPSGSVLSRYDTSPLTEEAEPSVQVHVTLPAKGMDVERPALASSARLFSNSVRLPTWTWREMLSILWVLGSALSFSSWIRSLWQLRKLTKDSKAATGTDLETRLAEACHAVGCTGPIQLNVCDDAIPPMTWGIFHHVILLPAAAMAWSRERQTLVLAHELAHIRRHDAFGQLLGQTVRSLYWFNPLVWYATHRLHVERERACDDYVLRIGAVDADYAEHLLQITRGLNSGAAQAAVSMAHPSQLKARLVAILDSRIVRSRASRFAATVLVAMIGVVTLSIAAVQVTEISAMVLPAIVKPLGVPQGSLVRSPEIPFIAAIMEPAAEAQQQPDPQAIDPQRAFIKQYCSNCHNRDDNFANLAFEDPNSDIAHVTDNRALWEKVVRRLRVGIENKEFQSSAPPPSETVNSVIQYLESELDRSAPIYVPRTGPHRLNRTEYVNAVRDLLDLEFDSSRLLPNDDSTSGFDNIARTLDTAKARTAYTDIAPILSRLAVEAPPNSPSRQRIFICTPSYRDAGGAAGCYQKIISTLTQNAFRGSSIQSDIDVFITAFNDEGGYERGLEAALSKILASPKFLYRTEDSPADTKPGDAYRINDIALASRLSYFLWSTGPDQELLDLARGGTLHNPAILEQQTLRMMRDFRAEAFSLNFAGQWLNLRSVSSINPAPKFFPEFDDALRQSMRRESELFFDSIIQEDRSVLALLTANYTFVNNRLAHLYGIPNITGEQFRRITLPYELDVRRGLLGKASILAMTSRDARTAPVYRGGWVMRTLLGVSPPDPPPSVPSLKSRSNDPYIVEPSMRQAMQDHKSAINYAGSHLESACVSCHRFTDPIGFSLENFNAIGAWRTDDGGAPINAADTLIDGTKVNGPVDLRNWLVSHSDIFVQTLTQKLMTYALGRGLDARDMPLIRAIDREAAKNGNRFSALILGIVKSDTFQMNSK